MSKVWNWVSVVCCILSANNLYGQWPEGYLHKKASDIIKEYENNDTIIAYGDFCYYCISGTVEKMYVLSITDAGAAIHRYIFDTKTDIIKEEFTVKSQKKIVEIYQLYEHDITNALLKGDEIFYDTVRTLDKGTRISETLSAGKMQYFYFKLGATKQENLFCCGILADDYKAKSKGLWNIIFAFNSL